MKGQKQTKPDTSSDDEQFIQGLTRIPMRVQIDMRDRHDYLRRMGKDFARYLAWYGDAQRALREMPAACTYNRLAAILDQIIEDRERCDVHGIPYPSALACRWDATEVTDLVAALKAHNNRLYSSDHEPSEPTSREPGWRDV